jgi:hypothetical protein
MIRSNEFWVAGPNRRPPAILLLDAPELRSFWPDGRSGADITVRSDRASGANDRPSRSINGSADARSRPGSAGKTIPAVSE